MLICVLTRPIHETPFRDGMPCKAHGVPGFPLLLFQFKMRFVPFFRCTVLQSPDAWTRSFEAAQRRQNLGLIRALPDGLRCNCNPRASLQWTKSSCFTWRAWAATPLG